MQINWLNLWTGGSAVVLIGADVALLSEAAAWALSGLIHLTPTAATVLYAVAGLIALWATVAFARKVHGAEPFFGPPLASAETGATSPEGPAR